MLHLSMTQLKQRLPYYIQSNTPVMIWGGPGEGKSGMVRAAVNEINGHLQDFRLLMRDSVDVHGLPKEKNDRMTWMLPEEIPLETDAVVDNHVMFLDELPAAPTSVQTVAYQMLHERMIDCKRLHKNVRFVAAGNRTTDGAVSNPMPSALKNRMAHIDVTCDSKAWVEWASGAGIFAPIVSYIEKSPTKLSVKNPKEYTTEFAFPTPRSWEYASNVCKGLESSADGADIYNDHNIMIVTDFVASFVGQATAGDFNAYMRIGANLPRPVEVVQGKAKAKKYDLHEQYFIQQGVLQYLSEYRNYLQKKYPSEAYQAHEKFSGYVDNTLKFVDQCFDAETLSTFLRRFFDSKFFGFVFNNQSPVQREWAQKVFRRDDERTKLIF